MRRGGDGIPWAGGWWEFQEALCVGVLGWAVRKAAMAPGLRAASGCPRAGLRAIGGRGVLPWGAQRSEWGGVRRVFLPWRGTGGLGAG
jgi:hypothetical protein